MPGVTRGFRGRAHATRDPRLPPGQYDTGSDWPVLTAEATPRLDPDRWTLTVDGLVENPTPGPGTTCTRCRSPTYEGDIHCVTTWSKLGTSFGGVSPGPAARRGRPAAARPTFVLATSTTGYTTNLPLADIRGGKAWIVWTHEGKPLPREHGGPVRLLVPHLYFWKSAKWVTPAHAARPRPAGLLGAQRLPRPRRPVARAAVPG